MSFVPGQDGHGKSHSDNQSSRPGRRTRSTESSSNGNPNHTMKPGRPGHQLNQARSYSEASAALDSISQDVAAMSSQPILSPRQSATATTALQGQGSQGDKWPGGLRADSHKPEQGVLAPGRVRQECPAKQYRSASIGQVYQVARPSVAVHGHGKPWLLFGPCQPAVRGWGC